MGNYNWEDIIAKQSDEEQYQTSINGNLPESAREIAYKKLLSKNIIKKDEKNKYIREIIDKPTLVRFYEYVKLCKDTPSIEEIQKMGLNEATSIRLVEFYNSWKVSQNQKRKKWDIILIISFFVTFILDYYFNFQLSNSIPVVPSYFVYIYTVSASQFKKNIILKTFEG